MSTFWGYFNSFLITYLDSSLDLKIQFLLIFNFINEDIGQ